MENIFHDVEDTEVYIDDIGAFSQSWDDHMALLRTILTKLQDNGFTINPLKCEWAVKETDWFGYCQTLIGLKTWKKKIEAVHRIQPQTSLGLLQGFIRMVNYYRDNWQHWLHILAPLIAKTDAPKKGEKHPPFQWTLEMQKAFNQIKTPPFQFTLEMPKVFDQMKALMAADVVCAYPDHNKPLHVFTDAEHSLTH
jgi:hypothetical protein